jgi:hypothetical protein
MSFIILELELDGETLLTDPGVDELELGGTGSFASVMLNKLGIGAGVPLCWPKAVPRENDGIGGREAFGPGAIRGDSSFRLPGRGAGAVFGFDTGVARVFLIFIS